MRRSTVLRLPLQQGFLSRVFVHVKLFQLTVIFASKSGACLSGSWPRPQEFRQVRKGITLTNTLA
jgi:hypothetical protein